MMKKSKSHRILIIQPICPAYRRPFFKLLARELGGISILHFDKKKKFEDNKDIKEKVGELMLLKSFHYVKNLRDIIEDYDIIVSVFDPHWINLFALPILYPSKRIIFWGHGFGKNKLINKLRVILAKKANALVIYDQIGKKSFIEKGIDEKKLFIAPNTLEVRNFEDTSLFQKNSLLFVGRLQRRKRLDLLLEAFVKLKLYEKEIVINIIGDGEEEKRYLTKKAENLKIKKWVRFIKGTADEHVLKDYFSQAYVYASPGAVGLGVLHSFAYGVPVITIKDESHGPEVNNIVNNETGFICNDFNVFCSSLLNLVEDNIYKDMGSNAYRYYKEKRQIANMSDGFKRAINFTQ